MIKYLGDPLTFELLLQTYVGVGATGQTPTVALRRVTDGYYLDFNDNTFKSSGWTTRQKALTEVNATNSPGLYQYVLATSSIIAATGDYVAEYSNTGTPAGVDQETYSYVAVPPTAVQVRAEMDANSTQLATIKAKTDLIPASPAAVGDAMTLTPAYDAAKSAASQTTAAAIKAKTDNLPADPSSEAALIAEIDTRLPSSGYTAPDNAGIAAIGAKTANLPSDPASESLVVAAIGTRLAAADYTAPDNADVAAIKAKTDNLPAHPAAAGDAMALTGAYDAAKAAASQASVNALPTLAEIEASTIIAKEASLIEAIALLAGYTLSNPTFDARGNMLTGTITTATKSYALTATYDSTTGRLLTYEITEAS